MDRRAIIAIVLCAAFLLFYRPLLKLAGFDHYLEPPAPRPTPVAVDSSAHDTGRAPLVVDGPAPTPGALSSSRPDSSVLSLGPGAPADSAGFQQTFQLETPLYRATFSDHGARLLTTELKHYASAQGAQDGDGRRTPRGVEVPAGQRVVLGGGPLFAVQSLANLDYAVVESLDAGGQKRALIFTADHPSGLNVRQIYRVRPDTYALDLSIELRGVPADWGASDYTLSTRSWPTVTEFDSVADARAMRATSLVGTSLRREQVGGLLKSEKRFEGTATWAAVHSRYFINAIVVEAGPARAVVSSAQRVQVPVPGSGRSVDQDVLINSLVMGLPSEINPVHRFVLYVGPSEYFRLNDVGHQLGRAVDLGWQWVLPFSRALLQLLNWLYGLLRNYGVAILAIATLVRLLLHPLNMMSMKSMRAMQKLQPELERIRGKFKNDPQAMNTAVMALYKDNKVNPAGGCLPMVLQMPLFIALYQVLFNAIELRQAPFIAWIDDLSAPDQLFAVAGFPIRLMPLLMLGSGLLAQVVTPTDPRQRSTMYLMNVVMLVFFYNLPSGLVLYWTIMNVLTALQQWLILRQDDVTPVPVPAAVVIPKRVKGRKPARS